jgi:ADP-ribose pyrophosphatase
VGGGCGSCPRAAGLGGEPPTLTAARELKEEAGLPRGLARPCRSRVDAGLQRRERAGLPGDRADRCRRPDAHDEEADLQCGGSRSTRRCAWCSAARSSIRIAVAASWPHTRARHGSLRPVDAPWVDRPHALAEA